MKYLQFSSLLFSTCVIHSFYVQNIIYHHLTLLVTILSILNHTYNRNNNDIIKIIDKIFAHYLYIHLTFIDLPYIYFIQPILIVCPIIILVIFIFEFIFIKHAVCLHFFLHICSVIFIHLYIYYLEILYSK